MHANAIHGVWSVGVKTCEFSMSPELCSFEGEVRDWSNLSCMWTRIACVVWACEAYNHSTVSSMHVYMQKGVDPSGSSRREMP